MRPVRFAVAAALCLFSATAFGGTIHPALQAQMDTAPADHPFSVIVNMAFQPPIQELDDALRARKAPMQVRHNEVIEELQAAMSTQDDLAAYLDEKMVASEVFGYTRYWIANLVVVHATRGEIERIASRPDVGVIEANFTPELIEPVEMGPPVPAFEDEAGGPRGIGVTPGLIALRAPEVWYDLGITGEGVLMANLDTGVDGNHPALSARWRGNNGHPWQECWLDVLGTNTQYPNDGYGHGTHVMGTECGLGAATQDTVGVAWSAQWIACNAINQGVGSGFDNDIITAFQWFADPDGNPNTHDDVPDVVQNSWGINEGFSGNPPYTDCDSRWWAVIDNAEAAGVIVTWSAGNEGPGSGTLRSPADRATTAYNVFSVGAVNATNPNNWPYPIASWSSRGPTGCNVPPELKIKPEVVAPGVNVYSSVPGGGYSSSYSGTSMAGPHVAGVAGLMREANPDIDVETVKQILMDTARDEGTTGEDNTYGWGFIDAYEAVIAATTGFGSLQGYVRNASWGDAAIAGAEVNILENGRTFTTDAAGFYVGTLPPGVYTAEADHPSFDPQSFEIEVFAEQPTVQDFYLTDIAGPTITGVTDMRTTTDTVGPYSIQATVADFSTVVSVQLYYRINGGSWIAVPMGQFFNIYTANIPGAPAGTQIDYYVWAQDGIGLEATEPANAPLETFSLYITEAVYVYEAEDPGDPDWTMGVPGDNATTGLWIRDDPVGTSYNGQQVQPEDDHTPTPGVKCFVTGNGSPGGAAGDNDVDGGCTTLLSPVFDLSQVEQAFVKYWRWWGQTGNATDDEFQVDVSDDGGTTWVPVERVPGNQNSWQLVTADLGGLVDLTDQVVLRFAACDLGSGGLVEAAIDDVSLEVFASNPVSTPEPVPAVGAALAQSRPNPFRPETATAATINFRLSNPAPARLELFDAAGRLVRVLHDGPLTSGSHEFSWDGRDGSGNEVGAGVYFYRLKAGAFVQSRALTVLK